MKINMPQECARTYTRRHFFKKCQLGLGSIALSSLIGNSAKAANAAKSSETLNPMAPIAPHFAPKAKRVIYLHMAGSPPQHELFDWKPKLRELNMQYCPDSLMENERFAFIKGRPKLLGTPYEFERCGKSGTWVSELLPHFKEVIDDVTLVKSMTTTQFNHAPAQMFLYTGNPRAGHASMGSWLTYGLGSENENLPGFVVLASGGTDPAGGKSLWGSGYLPAVYQGVQCRSKGDPILYVSDPKGMNRSVRRSGLDAMRKLNEIEYQEFGDPQTLSRIAQYELAYRMQIAVPEVMDISKEPAHIHEMYGTEPGKESFANNCLLARRLVEQGVRFVQLFDWGWDYHGVSKVTDISQGLPDKMKETDRPMTALIKDLKQRGLLEDTLVVWGGEFGRTPMNEERNGSTFLGRDHHQHAFTIWMAGGGVKPGNHYGETDDLGFHVTQGKMTVHDLQATILHLVGMDAHKLKFFHKGLNHRLIGPTNEPKVNHQLIA